MKRARDLIGRVVAVVCVLLVTACGDDKGTMTEPTPNPAPPQVEPEPRVATVEIAPESVALSSVGSSAELTAVAKDESGRVMVGVPFVWQSSDPTVAVVDSAGRVVSRAPGSAVVTAVAGGVPGHVPVTVTQTAAALAFRAQPSDAVAGASLSPAIQVEIRDEVGQRVRGATDAVTLSLVGGGEGAELQGTRTVNAVDGVATFSGLAVERAGSGYKVRASAGELEAVESEAFGIVPGAPSRLGFLAVPEEVVAGDTFAVRVGIQDVYGNPVPSVSAPVALYLAVAPEGAELGGSLEAQVEAGVAGFESVLEKAGSAYVLAASAPGLEGARSERFRVVPGEPRRLVFIDPPDSVTAGFVYTHTVGVIDAYGNRVRGIDGVDIRIAITADEFIRDTTLVMMDGEVSLSHRYLTYHERLQASWSGGNWNNAYTEPFVAIEWTHISAGHDRTCGIGAISVLYCWGNNADRALGTDRGSNLMPQPVATDWGWRDVAVGREHICAIQSGSWTVHCWGSNEFGQLGINDPSVAHLTEPTPVDSNQQFSGITAGQYHTCAVTRDTHRVLCWGRNDHGQLGSAGGDAYAPRPIELDQEFIKVVAGWNHTCAIRRGSPTAGHAYCWGDNGSGQLGNQSRISTTAPDSVRTTRQFRDIAAGSQHTCGVGGPGDSFVYCWGANSRGQLGTGDTHDRSYPVQAAVDHFQWRVAAGAAHSCAVIRWGPLYCWGDNAQGQLGLLTRDPVSYLPRRAGPER